MRRSKETRIVMPLDFEEAVTWSLTLSEPVEPSNDDELDWCFDDAELTRSLRALKSGRRTTIALLFAAMAVLATGLVFLS